MLTEGIIGTSHPFLKKRFEDNLHTLIEMVAAVKKANTMSEFKNLLNALRTGLIYETVSNQQITKGYIDTLQSLSEADSVFKYRLVINKIYITYNRFSAVLEYTGRGNPILIYLPCRDDIARRNALMLKISNSSLDLCPECGKHLICKPSFIVGGGGTKVYRIIAVCETCDCIIESQNCLSPEEADRNFENMWQLRIYMKLRDSETLQ